MNIAILGCGTVAGGVLHLLENNREEIRERLGEELSVKRVLARHPEKARALGLSEEQICTDFSEILADSSIALVVELIGGTGDAYRFVRESLLNGRHVVTANKDLIALYPELAQLAEEQGVMLLYEASVGGGIPLLGPLRQTLAANRIESIYGILNGTTNYILTRMSREGLGYAEALRAAQAAGYAEANPASDVEGADAARKIAILASLAFRTRLTYPQIYHEGIEGISETDIRFAARQGYTVKLLAVTREEDGRVEAYVRPALVPLDHPLASVNGAYNAVFLRGDAVGDIMLYGQGAGADPTASSVVGDIMEICRNHTVSYEGAAHSGKTLRPVEESDNIYYVRLLVADKPRVLAGVAGAFGDFGVSIASLVQEPREGGRAELMLLTHRASEEALRAAEAKLLQQNYVEEIHTLICLEDSQ